MKVDNLKLLIIQPETIFGNSLKSIYNVERLINSANCNPNLILLPEMFSTGFSMNAEKYSETMCGNTVKWLCNKAKELNSAFITSVMIKDNGKYYNRGFFVFPDGKYQTFDKRHLFGFSGEDSKYVKGENKIIVDFRGWRILPLICYDLRFPVWSRNCNNYDLLVYVASWPKVRQNVWSILPIARAIENQCYVATCNRVGEDKSGVYSGESKVVFPSGEIAAQSQLDKECFVYCELFPDYLDKFRKEFPFANDADNFKLIY